MFTKIQNQLKSNKGFTLIELMVVISIIAVLVAIALPRFAEARRSSNTAKVAADLRSIDSAITMFQAATGNMPTAGPVGGSELFPAAGTRYFASLPTPPASGDIRVSAVAGGVAVDDTLAAAPVYNLSVIATDGLRGTIAVTGNGTATYENFVGFARP